MSLKLSRRDLLKLTGAGIALATIDAPRATRAAPLSASPSWRVTGQDVPSLAIFDQMRQSLRASAVDAQNKMPGIGGLASSILGPTVQQWINNALPDTYGMCGGMAYAALDYFVAGKPLPRGTGWNDHPQENTPAGKALREYLWQRQMQSFTVNAPTLLGWMMMLHIDLPFVNDGPAWLLQRTIGEWIELKGHLDRGTPWPLGLVGTSLSPFDNHQVLAIGYDDPGNGTGTLYLYDSNCPDAQQATKLDFRHTVLVAEESCPSPARGALRGFFCENYAPVTPPDLPATFSQRA